MNAADPNFFILLLLGGTVLYGLWPVYGVFALTLAALWVLGKAPLLFFLLVGVCLFPWRWFLAFFIGGYAAGLGAGFGFRRPRYPRRSRWTRSELDRADLEDRRSAPRGRGRREGEYMPFDDFGE